MTNKTPLTVYSASAGSGKTFTLAVEYIKLLISDPTNYRYTLAVTFTNKATQEMKQRILTTLYGIANALPDSDSYYSKIKEAFPNTTERVIRNRADEALKLLIHDYNRFRVETIDSFFQRVLRNLARELGLTANLQVMLNDAEVESQAVDDLISDIDSGNDPLLGWIMDFINERMADDKSWNVIGQIKDFGRNIFTDFYKDHQTELHAIMDDAEFFKHYNSTLRAIKGKALKDMKDFADQYDAIASHYGLTDSNYTHGHSNVPGYFENLANGNFLGDYPKMPNSYITKGLEDPEKFVKKSDLDKPETAAIISEVAPLLRDAEEARQKAAVVVNSVDLTLQNINQLRLLGRIEKQVNDINAKNNDYPLSNTQKLLASLIDGHDSPFIYEKIGGQLRYIMIDEFQDTSVVQWNNFKVLLDDCLAHQNGSLIVGDVKQSIYRWRNGDWQLLQNLNSENYPGVVEVKNLDTNYRSDRNVIDFNNKFFTSATSPDNPLLEEDSQSMNSIPKLYSTVVQKVPDPKPKAGLVKVTLLSKENYDSEMIDRVKETIVDLLEHGVPQNKIAIIVRKNKNIKLLADYFLHNAVTVNGEERMLKMVSDEAFRLDASLAVNIIINALRHIVKPEDKLVSAFLDKATERLGGSSVVIGPEIQYASLIDLVHKISDAYHLGLLSDQSAYVCAFNDQLSKYLQKHITGIKEFLDEWDENLCGKSIHSDEVDGIRMLTVHKSKGLEFDNVIIPYCDWKIEDARDILWVEPKIKPFNELPVVPVNLQAKKLQNSIYYEAYESEHQKSLIDNLNILYVAFTRASRNLFVIGKRDSSDYPSKLIQASIANDFNEVDDALEFSYGSLDVPSAEEEKDKNNDLVPQPINIELKSPVAEGTSVVHFVQSNDSTDFMTPDDELEDLEKRKSYINTGNILHKLFASIHDYTEIDKAIDEMEFDGVLYEKPITREQLKEYISKELNKPRIHDWFSPQWKVFNECSILYYDEAEGRVAEQRPDRVIYDGNKMIVIDFKTGRQLEKHKTQVFNYMHLLREMGYKNVSGYLWYIHHNEIVEVS